jgi:hypothetical protein
MALIRGLSYPLQVSNGRLLLSEDSALVEEHIISVLETRPFERVMRADYGLKDYTFETLKPTEINAKISLAVSEEVPEAENLEVTGNFESGDQGLYVVRITYSLAGVPQPPLNLSLVI